MNNKNIPYQTIDWTTIPKTEHKGEKGTAFWQTVQFDGLRIRIVEYSRGYLADHWCQKGHIVFCLEGDVVSELEDGSKSILTKGKSYVVSDDLSSHRSSTENGVKFNDNRWRFSKTATGRIILGRCVTDTCRFNFVRNRFLTARL